MGVSTLFRSGTRAARDRWADASVTVRLVVLAALAAVSGVVLWRILAGHELIDLQVYRFGVDAWRAGSDPYGPMPKTSVGVALPYLYPPPSLLIIAPLALVPLSAAKALMTGLSVLALAATAYVVISRCWPRATTWEVVGVTALVLPVALVLEPVRETLTFGQINLWLMALVAVDCLARRPRWPRGLLVGIAFALKLTPAAFILFFLLRRDYRAALTTVLSGAVFVALGFLFAWKDSVAYWLSGAGPTDGVSGTPYGTNQTILAALKRLVIPETAQTVGWIALVGVTVFVAVLLMVRLDAPTALVVNAALALLISPTAWSHHWVFIVPALLVFAFHAVHQRLSVVLGLGYLVVFLIGPHLHLPRGSDTELAWKWYEHIIGDSYVLLALIALGVTMWKVRDRKPRTDREMARAPEFA
ncbi:glycosyltransferase family 87 protein [Actinokineospora fastidiosa]|uniref:Membrane protein n=1 Tax=Actinokineospora fastidiosa TaxID=1816 RepID=A0A918GEK7_9PSEU|nr:glycosyltransferase family 87 protein [Actinokineospora fastidiosa]GGS31500.1 membrane protein [Actinokineospora fastidiosa]